VSTVKRSAKYILRVLLGCRCAEMLGCHYSFCHAHRHGRMICGRDLCLTLRNLTISAPTSLPPHDAEIYRAVLTDFARHPYESVVMPLKILLSGEKREDVANIYLRHDVDISPPGLETLCSIESELGFVSSIYVLAAREKFFHSPYEISEFGSLFGELRAQGFEVGLHTVAYAAPVEQMLDCFTREIELFEVAMGYLPETFAFHGWPDYEGDRHAKRALFAAKLLEHRGRFSHFVGKMSDYFLGPTVDISDSGIPWPKSAKEIRHYYPGEIACVLSHPCYWSSPCDAIAKAQS
jgi:hypothetical protein